MHENGGGGAHGGSDGDETGSGGKGGRALARHAHETFERGSGCHFVCECYRGGRVGDRIGETRERERKVSWGYRRSGKAIEQVAGTEMMGMTKGNWMLLDRDGESDVWLLT